MKYMLMMHAPRGTGDSQVPNWTPEAFKAKRIGRKTPIRLAGHHRLDAVRAHFFEMDGNRDRAIAHYRAAAARTTSIPEKNYLTTKAARLATGPAQKSGVCDKVDPPKEGES